MKVFGVSQTSGAERCLEVSWGGNGIVLSIQDPGTKRAPGREHTRLLLQEDDLLPTITDPVPGGTTVAGTSPVHGWKMLLKVEVRRNEVWLSARPATALVDEEIAVGLDDFQDALDDALGNAARPL